uniref:Uncharacterized protein n=1 Tax=Rhizophora mucronata TaxID=61149 RepID=A0A2P2MP10_RHIMU
MDGQVSYAMVNHVVLQL